MDETSTVESRVWVFETEAMADQAWERFASSEYNDCIRGRATARADDDDDVNLVNARVGGLSFGGFADRTAAAQFVLELESDGFEFKAYQDLIWLQDDTAVAALGFVSVFSAPLTFLEEELAGKVADRMAVATG